MLRTVALLASAALASAFAPLAAPLRDQATGPAAQRHAAGAVTWRGPGGSRCASPRATPDRDAARRGCACALQATRESSDTDFMCDASHPAVLQLDAEAFASPPALRTFVADKGDGTYEVQLLWSPSGERGTGGNKRDGEVEVGKLEFHEGIPGKLKRVLGARVPPWHLKNVYVLPQLRGRGCGEQLIEGMADQLVSASAAVSDEAAAGCEDGVFVYLRHLDNGNGKLVRYYSQLGFLSAVDISPDLGQDLMIAKLSTLLERLKGRRY